MRKNNKSKTKRKITTKKQNLQEKEKTNKKKVNDIGQAGSGHFPSTITEHPRQSARQRTRTRNQGKERKQDNKDGAAG